MIGKSYPELWTLEGSIRELEHLLSKKSAFLELIVKKMLNAIFVH